MTHKATVFRRILISVCIILIGVACFLSWPRTVNLEQVRSTIRKIDHGGARLVTERMPTSMHDPIADMLRHWVGGWTKEGGATGFPDGAAQYQFQASAEIFECNLFYQNGSVYYIKIVSPTSAMTTAREIMETLRKQHPGVWIRLEKSP